MKVSKYTILFIVLFLIFLSILAEANTINYYNRSSDAIYGLGFIGAAIYFLSNAKGFWMGVLGFLKAVIWPVFLVYELLKFLKCE
jgi:hypothetical protein